MSNNKKQRHHPFEFFENSDDLCDYVADCTDEELVQFLYSVIAAENPGKSESETLEILHDRMLQESEGAPVDKPLQEIIAFHYKEVHVKGEEKNQNERTNEEEKKSDEPKTE